MADSTDLDERKKVKLSRKIDELAAMFAGGSKPSLQAIMVVIASIFTAINQAEAAIIKLPDVVTAVLEVFGQAQEDADEKLLKHEVRKLIEHHRVDDTSEGPSYDLNDDIPF